MRKRNQHIIILLLTAVGLCSCNFFDSEVPYNGKRDKGRLVVNSFMFDHRPMRVQVAHSWFFTDSTRFMAGNEYGALKDAVVTTECRPLIGSGREAHTWSLTGKLAENGFFYVSPDSLPAAGGDTLLLHVSQPEYGEAFGVQVMPHRAKAQLTAPTVNSYGQLTFSIVFEPYTGNESDVVLLQLPEFTVYGTQKYNKYIYAEEDPISNYGTPYLYSRDLAFDVLDNKRSDSGYFGGQMIWLSAKSLKDGATVQLIADGHVYQEDTELKIDSAVLNLEMFVCTNDAYLYLAGRNRMYSSSGSLPEPSSVSTSDERETDLFALLGELFDELGRQEDYQLYGNLAASPDGRRSDHDDPFGIFAVTTSSEQFVLSCKE